MDFIYLKQFINLVDLEQEAIVDAWLGREEVQSIFALLDSSPQSIKISFALPFMNAIVSKIRWNTNISDCKENLKFLRELKCKGVSPIEIAILYNYLKMALNDFFYLKGVNFKKLREETEKIFTTIILDLSQNYSELIIGEDIIDNNLKLLNEYKKAVDESNIVSKTDAKGKITYVNDKFCEISGYNRAELLGRPHNVVRHPLMPKEAFKELWDTIKSKEIWQGVVKNLKKDGNTYIVNTTIVPILDNRGDVVEYIAIRHDITDFEQAKEQLKTLNLAMRKKVNELYDMTSNLETQAQTDNLTGTFNRNKFDEALSFEIQKAKAEGNSLSVILLDIDRFKNINDTYGHQAGDYVLKEIVDIITPSLKRLDIFARWGGEEFIILTPNTDVEGGRILAEKIRVQLEKNIFNEVGYVTSSFGVAQYHSSDSVDSLIERADRALYKAKKNGRNRVEINNDICFNPDA